MGFQVNNFTVASYYNRVQAEGGGVLILVRNSFKFKERKDICCLSIERVCEVACVETDLYVIICLYRPPSSNFVYFLEVMEDILRKIKSNKNILVCGDFNINVLLDSSEKDRFLSLMASFRLNCLFAEPTRVTPTSSSCIDNIITNFDVIGKCLVTGVRSDHKCQMVSLSRAFAPQQQTITVRSLSKKRLELFSDNVETKLQTLYHSTSNPNEMYSTLFNCICAEFNKYCKVKSLKVNNNIKFSVWATKGIRRSRDVLYELYDKRSYTSDVTFHNYVRNYSKVFKTVCIMAKSEYISTKIKNSDNKIKTTWQILNAESGKKTRHDKLLTLNINDKQISDKQIVANFLDKYFTNIPIETTKDLLSSPDTAESFLRGNVNTSNPSFNFRLVNSSDITNAFKNIKRKGTEDLWGLSTKAIASIIENIAPFLALIFNCCITDGIFPDLMKMSKIIPIYKSGCSKNPSNYRPISILPVLSKIFERILLNQMLAHFNFNRILHVKQFGFTKGSSTQDAGSSLVKSVLEAWENSQDALGVFCDLSKAFDCVDHHTLLMKLRYYGVSNNSLNLLKSYLSGRVQKVSIDRVTSQGSIVKMGVPQGSILGPFLFLVYINDLPYIVERMSDIVLFADDTSLIFKIGRRDNDLIEPNNTLNLVSNWFSANNLLLNAGKTKCIRFSLPNVTQAQTNIKLHNEMLQLSSSTVFLGVTLDSKLQWGPHIQRLADRLSSAAFAIWKIRQITNVETARLVYFAYFHSILAYGILLWGSAADIESIFILQKRAVRAIYKLGSRDSLRTLFKQINILTVPSEYILQNIMYVRKHINEFKKKSDQHSISTRNRNGLVKSRFRLCKTDKSFLGNSVRFYNKLPVSITQLNATKFKACVKNILMSKGYYTISDYINDRITYSVPTDSLP